MNSLEDNNLEHLPADLVHHFLLAICSWPGVTGLGFSGIRLFRFFFVFSLYSRITSLFDRNNITNGSDATSSHAHGDTTEVIGSTGHIHALS
jgi:hypothetical protein